MKKLFVVTLFALALGFATVADALLIDNGQGLIYDQDLNITWYDYSYMGIQYPVGMGATWQMAMNWATNLAVNVGGTPVTGWTLPTSDQYSGYNDTVSELGHLYYTELGNSPGFGSKNFGPFVNLQPDAYWSSTESTLDPTYSYYFNFLIGYQNAAKNDGTAISWGVAVHAGDIAPPSPGPGPGPGAVPEPTTMLLLGSGLIGLAGYGRKKFFKK